MNITLFIIGWICVNVAIAFIISIISWTKDALTKKALIIGLALAIIGMVCQMISIKNAGF